MCRHDQTNERLKEAALHAAGQTEAVAEQGGRSFFRQHFTGPAATAIVSGLVTLAGFCAVYLFNAAKSMRAMQGPVLHSLQDDREQMDIAKRFTDQADDAVARDNAVALKYFSQHNWYKPHYYADESCARRRWRRLP